MNVEYFLELFFHQLIGKGILLLHITACGARDTVYLELNKSLRIFDSFHQT